jgi:hypothetical protein
MMGRGGTLGHGQADGQTGCGRSAAAADGWAETRDE